MPDIQPFRAWRYDLGQVGRLSDVVAPPYDVIDEALQRRLYERHPYNVVRLILNRQEPGDDGRNNRYRRAARTLKEWQREGILRQDPQPCLYVYHQDFTSAGRHHLRRGVLARVRLEKFGEGRIFPHEQTLAGPKADRLQLLRATEMNLCPVFGIYPDPDNEIQARLDASVGRSLPLEATDLEGTTSRLWPVCQGELIGEIQRLFFPKPVFLADGHHRYETALTYWAEQQAEWHPKDDMAPAPLHNSAVVPQTPQQPQPSEGSEAVSGPWARPADAPSAASFILMHLVSTSDPGLCILPTHRLVSGGTPLDAAQLKSRLQGYFDLAAMGAGAAGAEAAWERIELEDDSGLLGFGTASDQQWQVGRLRDLRIMDELAAEHSPAWRRLGVSILHELVLGRLLADCGPLSCQYAHRLCSPLQCMSTKSARSPATWKKCPQNLPISIRNCSAAWFLIR
jgi:uncharacterized protein (DUF1015 family)